MSCIPGLVAAGVVIWMAATHHAHLNIPLIRNAHDWIYWPIATVAWFIAASGIPFLISFLLWVASHLTPQP